MATLAEKLMQIITQDLQGHGELETLPDGYVCGDIISPLFEGKDYHDRRVLIREALNRRRERHELSDEEQKKVSTLLTYTPNEWNVVLTDTPD